jgi:predicted acyltransferase
VICTIPTIATTILGMLLGELLMSSRSSSYKMKVVAATGAAAVILGFALDPVIPIVMKMWTTSYGLASAGWACLMFLFFYWIVDVRGLRRWAFPFVVIGMNAVAIYMSQSIVPWAGIVGIFASSLQSTLGSLTPLLQAIVTLLVEWLVLYWMYRRKLFLTA